MLQIIARRLFRREERARSASRFPSGAAPIAPAFHPPSTPGALPKPANFIFSPDRDLPLEQGIEAALPSRASVQVRFWGGILIVLLIEVSAIQVTGVDTAYAWLVLGAVPITVVFGGMAGWAHVMAYATSRLPGVLRAALNEMPTRYETMRQAKAEQGVRAPLWLSYAMAGIMSNVVWPITTQALRDRLGMVRWLSLRPVRRVFSSSAEYASSVIRNEHTRYQHLQLVLKPASVGAVEERDMNPGEEAEPFALDNAVPDSTAPDNVVEWGESVEPVSLHAQSDPATQTSIREAVDASVDDIEQVTATDARRLWWTMTTFAAFAYATVATLLSVVWLLGR